jgi:hypothetical protein
VQVPEQSSTIALQAAFWSQESMQDSTVHATLARLCLVDVELVEEMTLPVKVVLQRML